MRKLIITAALFASTATAQAYCTTVQGAYGSDIACDDGQITPSNAPRGLYGDRANAPSDPGGVPLEIENGSNQTTYWRYSYRRTVIIR